MGKSVGKCEIRGNIDEKRRIQCHDRLSAATEVHGLSLNMKRGKPRGEDLSYYLRDLAGEIDPGHPPSCLYNPPFCAAIFLLGLACFVLQMEN